MMRNAIRFTLFTMMNVACCLGAAVVFSASGVDVISITPARDAFRSAIGGGTVAGANGSFGGLRREINWDGVPDTKAAPNNLNADFFNVNSPRGVVFSTPGTGFQVSANSGVAPVNFSNIDASYQGTFLPFSPQRLFTALGSNILDVNFFIAGTTTPAATNAFGAIFSDVDANTTSIQYFNEASVSLGTFSVPAFSGSQTFSFLGVRFNAGEKVTRVRIVNGNAALAAGVFDNGVNDLVVMDDFLYAEPAAIPEPATWVLSLAGLALVWKRRFRHA